MVTSLFSGATITVVPRSVVVTIAEELTLTDEGSGGLALSYDKFNIDQIGTEAVTAAGEEEVERRAEGQITIYNAASEQGEPLIANTRFETETGNIYRISES